MTTQSETCKIPIDAAAIAISCDSDDLAIWDPSPSGTRGIVDIWDTSRGTCILTLEYRKKAILPPNGLSFRKILLALSRQSQRVVAAVAGVRGPLMTDPSDACQICVWHLITGALLCKFMSNGKLNSLDFSADGHHLALGASDRHNFDDTNDRVEIWDAKTGAGMRTMQFSRPIRVHGFDPTDSSRLRTSAGLLRLDKTREISVGQGAPMEGGILCGYGVGTSGEDADWILKGMERLLWLRVELRSGWGTAVEGNMVAIGCNKREDGVEFLEFAWGGD